MAQFDQRRLRNTPRYKRMRRGFLISNPLCAQCARDGFTVGADELDHIVPVSVAPDRFWDETNFQGLCRSCHEKKTAEENKQPERVAGMADWHAWAGRFD